jgi:hypothetical protein
MAHHLAQLNIGRILAPVDDPIMYGFMSKLDEINALAERSPGFVWRLKTDEGNATAIRPYEDNMLLVNMSVWESLDDLRQYVYRSNHADYLRQRKQWFEKFEGPYMVMWWIPAGHIPTVEEAKERLEHLRTHGDSAHAFTFAKPFAAPESHAD